MKYIAIDELNHFEFHDAKLEKIDFRNGNMIWQLFALNANKKNTQNNFDKDMCIAEAKIVFEHFNIAQICFGAYKVYDLNNVLIKSVEAKTANPDEYFDILRNSLGNYCYILNMEELPINEDKKQLFCFNIDGSNGNYDFIFSFSKSIVQWDDYNGEAWYEGEEWKKK